MKTAMYRIVLQVMAQEKKAITEKATKVGLPISELMRHGAPAYESHELDEELGIFADKAKAAADRASESIDDVSSLVAASHKRIALMEAKAAKARTRI